MKSKWLYFLFIFTFTFATAQTNLDSLYTVWLDNTQADSTRIKSLNYYIWDSYLFNQPDSALIYSDQLLDFSKSKNSYFGIAAAHHLKGIAYYVRSDYDSALKSYFESIEYRKKAEDKKGLSSTLGNIGLIYGIQGNYTAALILKLDTDWTNAEGSDDEEKELFIEDIMVDKYSISSNQEQAFLELYGDYGISFYKATDANLSNWKLLELDENNNQTVNETPCN